jgi:restriction endonuclease S subunit
LAYYLSRKIKEFSENTSVGAVMPSIGRPELESFKIPILPVNEQKAIGELWYQGIEKKKMLLHLAKLENEKELYLLNKYVDKKMGGSKHDNI